MQTKCCIYFNTEINGGWVNLSWSGVKEGEIKIIHKLVYVWLRRIYLAISAKTSSCKEHHCVRNMISLRYRKIFHTAEKLQGFISFGHQTHSWLLLTARTNRRGGAVWLDRSSLHTTEGVLHFPSLTTRKKNCAYRRNGITESFCGFETVTFPNHGILWKRL